MKLKHSVFAYQAILALWAAALPAQELSFKTIDVPGAASTQAWAINSHGEIVGLYVDAGAAVHGFLLKGGAFTTIDFPGATSTQVFGINPQGDIVGVYTTNGVTHGFLLSGGRFTTIDPPGSTRSGGAGINASGDIVGDCLIDGVTHGFVLQGNHYEIVDYPGSASGFVNSNNARGDIVGNYVVNNVTRGYARRGGEYSSFELPGAMFTGTYGMNAAGEIAGRYRDSANVTHGFYWVNGEFTRFDYPGATLTAGNAIAANGDIVGRYTMSDGINHGYLLSRGSRPQYKVTDLGTLGGNASIAYGMNSAGWIAGAANLASQVQHAFLFRDGKMADLGTLGGLNAAATNPNGAGQITVISETNKPDPAGEDFCAWGTHQTCLTAVWKDGKLTSLPTLGGNNSLGFVMNEHGQTVGAAETTMRDSTCHAPQVFRFQPVIWSASGQVQPLRLPTGDTVGVALGINERGEAVGTTGTCADTAVSAIGLMFGPHAVLWRNGIPTSLGPGVAASINNRGEAIGGSPIDEHSVHGFLWTTERGMRDLGTVGEDVSSFPTVVNNSGQITGGSCDAEMNCRAFLWDQNSTTMADLNDLVPAGSGLYLVFASWINDAGDIAGQAVDEATGDLHAFLATSVRGGTPAVSATRAPIRVPFAARKRLR